MKYAIILALLAHPALASEPDEATKINALKLGYVLNGNSMVRWGSIDLSKPISPPCTQCSPVPDPATKGNKAR